jgi:hypothetical protein
MPGAHAPFHAKVTMVPTIAYDLTPGPTFLLVLRAR